MSSDGGLEGLGGLLVTGGDAAPLLQAVEAPFHYVAMSAGLVGPLGDGVADAALSQPSADGPGAVTLVTQDVGGGALVAFPGRCKAPISLPSHR